MLLIPAVEPVIVNSDIIQYTTYNFSNAGNLRNMISLLHHSILTSALLHNLALTHHIIPYCKMYVHWNGYISIMVLVRYKTSIIEELADPKA